MTPDREPGYSRESERRITPVSAGLVPLSAVKELEITIKNNTPAQRRLLNDIIDIFPICFPEHSQLCITLEDAHQLHIKEKNGAMQRYEITDPKIIRRISDVQGTVTIELDFKGDVVKAILDMHQAPTYVHVEPSYESRVTYPWRSERAFDRDTESSGGGAGGLKGER